MSMLSREEDGYRVRKREDTVFKYTPARLVLYFLLVFISYPSLVDKFVMEG
jgi:hypothetical protein